MRLNLFQRYISRKRYRGLKKSLALTGICLISLRLLYDSICQTGREERFISRLPPANATIEAPSPSPQPTAERELTNDASYSMLLNKTDFPDFYHSAPGLARSSQKSDDDEYLNLKSFPSQIATDEAIMVHISESDCGFGEVMQQTGREMKLNMFTLKALPSDFVDLQNAPISIIGTSKMHARSISTYAVAELVSHMAVWRELFHSNATSAIVTTDGYVPRTNIPTRFNHFDVALLDSQAKSYVLSSAGAAKLLSYSTAFVRPLPELLWALARMKVINLLHVHDGSNLSTKYYTCKMRSLSSVRTAMSDEFPYYPPHHPLYEINDVIP